MIVYRRWQQHREYLRSRPAYDCDGWFLFGLVPLYVRKVEVRTR